LILWQPVYRLTDKYVTIFKSYPILSHNINCL